ncbi:unnamed protein product [Orchesella dallaii]|uniref:Transmembrane protein n=1 Tax=Orchesella dallaii TaxID=48710 RepID=A0ABP1QU13_9HEXA
MSEISTEEAKIDTAIGNGNAMEKDPSLVFSGLATLELVYNVCRIILTVISVRYYMEIIKATRQNTSIRLSDFMDAGIETQESQEFHNEMMNEYPGRSHNQNVIWYIVFLSFYITTIFMDLLALSAVFSRMPYILLIWILVYPVFSAIEVIVNVVLLKRCTNEIYFNRKWGHFFFSFAASILYRLYLLWTSTLLMQYHQGV